MHEKQRNAVRFFQLTDRADNVGYIQKKMGIRQMVSSACKEQIKANFLIKYVTSGAPKLRRPEQSNLVGF
jgi:hypothetical protein